MSLDLKDAYFHIQIAPYHRLLLEFAVPGSPHFYTMHGCGSLPSATDGNPHTQLPRWLAQSDPVRGGFDIAQYTPPQPLRLPGAQCQFCQEHTVTQINNIFSTSMILKEEHRIEWVQLDRLKKALKCNDTSSSNNAAFCIRMWIFILNSINIRLFFDNPNGEHAGHARTGMFSASRNCVQILATRGRALSCCNMR